jgi:HEAT repeats
MGKKRRLSFWLSLSALALMLVTVSFWSFHEPRYEGKTLSAWLIEYQTNRWPLDKDAEKAIQHFGTNAAPVLLKMMSTRGSRAEIKLLTIIPRRWEASLHLPTTNSYANKIYEYRSVGASGFMALGELGRPAVPNLILLTHDSDGDVRYLSFFALRCLGPVAKDALPELTNCLADPDYRVRCEAITAMGTIHTDPEHVVPLVVDFLRKYQTDQMLSSAAIVSLGQFKSDARAAVPAIQPFLNNENLWIREDAIYALMQIDPEAAAKASVK